MIKINTIIADDHQLIREGLSLFLENSADINVISAAKNSEELLALYNIHKDVTDVVLLDYHMPNISAVEMIKELQNIDKEVKIVMLSSEKQSNLIIKVLNLGVLGYILKDDDKSKIIEAINFAYKGRNCFSKDILIALASSFGTNSKSNKDIPLPLSGREKEVLNLTAHGLTNYEIGDELRISYRTVDTHKSNMLKKTGAKNITHLVKMACDFGEI